MSKIATDPKYEYTPRPSNVKRDAQASDKVTTATN